MTTIALIYIFIFLEVLTYVIPKNTRINIFLAHILIRSSMLIIVLAMVLTGYSEYLLVYSVFLILFTIIAIRYILIKIKNQKDNMNKSIVKTVLLSLLWLIAFMPFLLFPRYEPLSTTGPYNVNLISYGVIDHDVHQAFIHRNEKREVNVHCYYPENATEEKPLIIYSHGGVGTPFNNESLLVELASYGYVSCTVAHPFHTLNVLSSEGINVRMDWGYFNELMRENVHDNMNQSLEYYQKWMRLRTHDLNIVIDDLLVKHQFEYAFLNHSNIEQVIVIGHSLGGSTALCMPRLREDIKAVIALESPYFCDIDSVRNDSFVYKEAKLDVSSFHIYSDTIYDYLVDWPQYERNIEIIALNDPFHKHIRIEGSGHFSLTDLGLMSPILTRILNRHSTNIDNKDVLKVINIQVVDFITSLSD